MQSTQLQLTRERSYVHKWLSANGQRTAYVAIGISLVRLGVDDIPVTPKISDLVPGRDFEDGDGDPTPELSPTGRHGRPRQPAFTRPKRRSRHW